MNDNPLTKPAPITVKNPGPLSFTFRGKNCREYGLIVNSYDFLLPEKRSRRIQIPFTSGSYDYSDDDNERFYNDRELRLRCIWMPASMKRVTRADVREMAHWLSTKGRIVLDVEPDKFYYGEIFDANELIAHYDFVMDNEKYGDGGGTTDGEFEVTFICAPFAFGKLVQQPIKDGINEIDYKGTAKAPTLIVLRNEGTTNIMNVQIVVSRRIY